VKADRAGCYGCGRVDGPITELVKWRVLPNPVRYVPFLIFCCGKTRRSEREVSLTIHNLWADSLESPQVAVLLEKETAPELHTGQKPLVGVATVLKEAQPFGRDDVQGMKASDSGTSIVVIGTDLIYRGRRLKDGKTRPANVLMEGTLDVIQSRFRGAMPYVKAAVLPENTGSKTLFDEHYFDDIGERGGAGGDQLILFRRPLVPVRAKREPSWSVNG
jgi:hypothetical protein